MNHVPPNSVLATAMGIGVHRENPVKDISFSFVWGMPKGKGIIQFGQLFAWVLLLLLVVVHQMHNTNLILSLGHVTSANKRER